MITFSVVKEPFGWAVQMGESMKTPFWSRDLAIREANCLADAISLHGERTEVIIEGVKQRDLPRVRLRGFPVKRLVRPGWFDTI